MAVQSKLIRILGITDTHGASACILENGAVIAAVEEERLNRHKSWRGMPMQSIKSCLHMTGLRASDIDLIAASGKNTPNIFLRHSSILSNVLNHRKQFFKPTSIIRKIYKNAQVFLAVIPFAHRITAFICKYLIKQTLEDLFKGKIPPIVMYDHHLTHAQAYYVSGFTKALTFTMDNQGDGISTAVFKCDGKLIQRIASYNSINSIGYFYDLITAYLGFNPVTDAGKTVGLSAYGKPDCYEDLKKRLYFNTNTGTLRCTVGLGFFAETVQNFFNYLKQFKNEDIACSAQTLVEDIICDIIKYYVRKTEIQSIVFSGGVAYNIKINQKILALDCVHEAFFFPAAGDNGLSVLAAQHAYQKYTHNKDVLRQLGTIYWGPSYSNTEIKDVLAGFEKSVDFQLQANIDGEVARLISKGKIVWRFQGRLEFGPRALGHRSILALPRNHHTVDVINKKLGREMFMPMCPSVLEENADEYMEHSSKLRSASYMIVSFPVKDAVKDKIPAVSHVDNTLRPQVLKKADEPRFWKIIYDVCKKTGMPLVLNTSFNRHGEPIVCSPKDAIESFIASDGEFLALEDYLVTLKK